MPFQSAVPSSHLPQLAKACLAPPIASHTVTDRIAADLVQDMYLKELKAYKLPAVKASDAEGHVQKFAMPASPQSPEETDIASDLQAYEAQVPEIEGQGVAGETLPQEQDWFEDPDEEPDVPKGGATH